MEVINSLANEYLEDVKSGRWNEEGWIDGSGPIYSESKIIVNAYTAALADSLWKSQPVDQQIFLASSFCLGMVLTDMALNAIGGLIKPPNGIMAKSVVDGVGT